MNNITEELLKKVNDKLNIRPLVYISRDIERGIGLEGLLDNYYIACIENNYIHTVLSQINSGRPKGIFCLNNLGVNLVSNSTLELVNEPKFQEWVKTVAVDGMFMGQFFQFSQPAIKVMDEVGGVILNSSAELNRKFEAKLSQFSILKENSLPLPKGFIRNISDANYKDIAKELDSEWIVVQLDRAHTGSGTFIIRSEEDYHNLRLTQGGNDVKITEYIKGYPYTINGCVTKKGIFVAGLQYQITGIPELTTGEGSTVGNDFGFASTNLSLEVQNKILNATRKIGEIMKADGFRGLFGIDLMVRGEDIFIIEINARQTANISFQTKLEIMQDQLPLTLINLCEWLHIEMPEINQEIYPLAGSQVFLRSKKDDFIISSQQKSGIYRLQSDNTARDLISQGQNDHVIYIDEEQDKPLIWQRDGYSIESTGEGGFVLLIQPEGNKRDKFDEVARMQFTTSAIVNSPTGPELSPWIIEAMAEIEDRVK
jgi:glutathione synthase/RimK-type ligase-like ATP-grasp enzyme